MVWGDTQTVSALALHAGLDMDMMTNGYITTLKKSLEEGRVSQAILIRLAAVYWRQNINWACSRTLIATWTRIVRKKNTFTDEHMNTARHIAGKSIVLLKNDKGLLPLRKTGDDRRGRPVGG